MLKKLMMALTCLFISSQVLAEETFNQKLEIATDIGFSLAFPPNYNAGLGSGLFVGFPLDDQLSLGFQTGFYQFNYSVPAWYDPSAVFSGGASSLELTAGLRSHLGEGSVRLLASVQGGFAYFSDNSHWKETIFSYVYDHTNTLSELSPMAKVGIGFEIRLNEGLRLYFISGVDVVFASYGHFSYIPLEPGLDFLF